MVDDVFLLLTTSLVKLLEVDNSDKNIESVGIIFISNFFKPVGL